MRPLFGRALRASAAVLLVWVPALPASAALVVDNVSVENSFGYSFDSGAQVQEQVGGTRERIFVSDSRPDPSAQIAIDYVGEAAPGSNSSGTLFFLHNNYCVGSCSLRSSTVITFDLRNSGSIGESYRFDSEITPGHIGLLGQSKGAITSQFDFTVTSSRSGTPLYRAYGGSEENANSVTTTDGRPFNNFYSVGSTPDGLATDWSATSLNLELGFLNPGETLRLTYIATYLVNVATGPCATFPDCDATQVVFGDPRNNGGGTQSIAARGFGLLADPPRDFINRDYDAYALPYAFVNSRTARPGEPAGERELSYGNGYTPFLVDQNSADAVPEPATWVTLIVGFGIAGGSLRRRTIALPRRPSADH